MLPVITKLKEQRAAYYTVPEDTRATIRCIMLVNISTTKTVNAQVWLNIGVARRGPISQIPVRLRPGDQAVGLEQIDLQAGHMIEGQASVSECVSILISGVEE